MRIVANILRKIMSTKHLFTVIFTSSFLMLGSAFGQKGAIEADVKGVDGRPSKGAEVRIERQDKKAMPVVTKTDGRGHAIANDLEIGTYKVTASVEGGIQASQIVKTRANKALPVAFDMRKTSPIVAKAKKRYIWVPAETGSRLGGHWVESDQDASVKSNGQNVDKMSGSALTRLPQTTGMGGGN